MADDSAQSLLLDARTAHDSGDLAGAERLYRRVLAAQPANADALHQFGVLACQQGNTRMAAKRIRRAIAIDGRAADFHLNLGVVLETAGDLDGALQCYRNALDRGAAALETLLRIESIVRQNRRYGVFAEILSKVIAAQPGLAEAHYLLGVAHMMRSRHQRRRRCVPRHDCVDPRLCAGARQSRHGVNGYGGTRPARSNPAITAWRWNRATPTHLRSRPSR